MCRIVGGKEIHRRIHFVAVCRVGPRVCLKRSDAILDFRVTERDGSVDVLGQGIEGWLQIGTKLQGR